MSQTIRKSSETEVIPDRSQTAFITQRMTRTVSLLCVLLLAGIGAVRIIATYSVFSQTYDEPAHIAAGMQWLDKGLYTYETLHPPLARVAVAFLPFLDGLRSMGQNDTWQEMWRDGNEILHARGSYYWNLALARLGVLPFFLLATGVVWGWSRRLFGNTTALLATILFTTLPPILAHSGLATTDMALTATFAADLHAESPAWAGWSSCHSHETVSLALPACLWDSTPRTALGCGTGHHQDNGYLPRTLAHGRSDHLGRCPYHLEWLPIFGEPVDNCGKTPTCDCG